MKNNIGRTSARTAFYSGIFATVITLIAVAGCGVSGSGLLPSATKVEFGNVAIGSSTSQLVTLTNVEKTNLEIAEISARGKGFTASGRSKMVLAPYQSITVSIAFNPEVKGKARGTLSVRGDASRGNLVRIALLGNGDAESGDHSVTLSWKASPSPAIGYFIYRSKGTEGKAFFKLNASMENSTSFTDSTVTSGKTYEYEVTSVSSNNVESKASNKITVTIPKP